MASLKLFILPCTFFLIAFFSCATTKGGTFEKTSGADKETAWSDSASFRIETDEKSESEELTITTVPENADVYIDNKYYGKSPLTIRGLSEGTYRIRIERQGYETYEDYVYYDKKNMNYIVELVRETGLIIVETEQQGAEVYLGGTEIGTGESRVSAGSYTLSVRLFGYSDYEAEVVIRKDRVTRLRVTLYEADFAVTDITLSRNRFNPENSGLLGKTDISFYVTAPGEGGIVIKDAVGNELVSKKLPRFSTWRQSFSWNGESDSGVILPDGIYTIEVSCKGEKNRSVLTKSAVVEIDRKAVISHSSVYCGVSGLLYCPGTSVLPESSMELGAILTAHGEPVDGKLVVRIPAGLSVRYAITDSLELNVLAAIISTNTDSLPFLASASVKYNAVNVSGFPGFGVGAYARASYHYGTGSDTFSNFSGAAIGTPIAITLGAFSLSVAPEIAVSPWKVTYTQDYDETTGFFSWLYLRSGASLSIGDLSIGASAVIRTVPFNEGLSIDMPMQCGAEIHYLVPDTQLFISGIAIAEIDSVSSFYISAGLGLSIIF